MKFESFVNSEECKTIFPQVLTTIEFESFVNSEECKTGSHKGNHTGCLRALLIQKSVKHMSLLLMQKIGLRALLIQKSVKLCPLNFPVIVV